MDRRGPIPDTLAGPENEAGSQVLDIRCRSGFTSSMGLVLAYVIAAVGGYLAGRRILCATPNSRKGQSVVVDVETREPRLALDAVVYGLIAGGVLFFVWGIALSRLDAAPLNPAFHYIYSRGGVLWGLAAAGLWVGMRHSRYIILTTREPLIEAVLLLSASIDEAIGSPPCDAITDASSESRNALVTELGKLGLLGRSVPTGGTCEDFFANVRDGLHIRSRLRDIAGTHPQRADVMQLLDLRRRARTAYSLVSELLKDMELS